MRILGTLLVASLVCGPVLAEPITLNLLAASEFGGGLGAGLEFGETNALVLGVGGPFGVGVTGDGSWFGSLGPGAAVGYRRYFGGWFLGPTAGANYRLNWSSLGVHQDGLFLRGLVDAGYRWTWKSAPDWNTKLGAGAGMEWSARTGKAEPAVALTLSIGFRL